MKRYFAVDRCVFNHQHFAGNRFYDEAELTRGLKPNEKYQDWEDKTVTPPVRRLGNKYMIQVVPKPKDRPEYEERLLAGKVAEIEGNLETYRKEAAGGRVTGMGAAIEQAEKILRELRSA